MCYNWGLQAEWPRETCCLFTPGVWGGPEEMYQGAPKGPDTATGEPPPHSGPRRSPLITPKPGAAGLCSSGCSLSAVAGSGQFSPQRSCSFGQGATWGTLRSPCWAVHIKCWGWEVKDRRSLGVKSLATPALGWPQSSAPDVVAENRCLWADAHDSHKGPSAEGAPAREWVCTTVSLTQRQHKNQEDSREGACQGSSPRWTLVTGKPWRD